MRPFDKRKGPFWQKRDPNATWLNFLPDSLRKLKVPFGPCPFSMCFQRTFTLRPHSDPSGMMTGQTNFPSTFTLDRLITSPLSLSRWTQMYYKINSYWNLKKRKTLTLGLSQNKSYYIWINLYCIWPLASLNSFSLKVEQVWTGPDRKAVVTDLTQLTLERTVAPLQFFNERFGVVKFNHFRYQPHG